MNRVGHQIRMVVVDAHDLSVIEHLFVNDVEIRAVGIQQHAFRLSIVGTLEVDLHFDVVEHTNGVGSGVITHGVDDE